MKNTNIVNRAKNFFGQFENLVDLEHWISKMNKADAKVINHGFQRKNGRTSLYFWVGKLFVVATTMYGSEGLDYYRVCAF